MSISSGLLKDTFTPYTLVYADDGVGGQTETWTAGTAFKGRLSILSAVERMGADKTTVFASHKLYCDPSVSLTTNGRIALSTRTFEIKTIQLPSNETIGIGHQEITLLEIL